MKPSTYSALAADSFNMNPTKAARPKCHSGSRTASIQPARLSPYRSWLEMQSRAAAPPYFFMLVSLHSSLCPPFIIVSEQNKSRDPLIYPHTIRVLPFQKTLNQ